MTGTIQMSRSRFVLAVCLVLALLGGSSLAAQGAPPEQGPLSGELDQKLTKVNADLLALHQEYQVHVRQGRGGVLKPRNSALPVVRDHVVVDAVASGDTSVLLADLEALGLRRAAAYGRIVSGQLPIDAIDELDALDSLNFVWPAFTVTNVGLVDSQGDKAMKADDARATWGVDGSGVTVGTISDSYDCAPTPITDAADDVANGDLPAGIAVLDDTGCTVGNSDEGRAMMQIITDVAPGADQAFHTGQGGKAVMAQAILDLAADGKADVIVDDLTYPNEPFFQDGILAQAVDKVVGMGVAYFSSAGNFGRNSYEDTFRSTGGSPFDPHDFDPGSGMDRCQSVTIPADATVKLTLQWDQPYYDAGSGSPGSASDLDIALWDETCENPIKGSIDGNVGRDPIDLLLYTNPGPATAFNLMIRKSVAAGGPNPGVIKYVDFSPIGALTINEYQTSSSTVLGHANARGAAAVGAAPYPGTPEFGVDPAVLWLTSSAGGTPILFGTNGKPLPSPEYRRKPWVVAPDSGNTTFFKAGVDPEPDGFPNFIGTSAAAPHAAGVAALLLDARASLTPAQVYSLLADTALDMDGPYKAGFPDGFDDDSGHGLVEANAALALLDKGTEESSVFLPLVLYHYDLNQLLGNGNFDTGMLAPWQAYSGSPEITDQVSRSAPYSARLAGRNDADDVLSQEVTVPSNATAVTLEYSYRVSSSDPSTTDPVDHICVSLFDGSENPVVEDTYNCYDFVHEPKDQWLTDQLVYGGADVTPLLGQTLYVAFIASTNATDPSTVWVDDVSLTVTR